MAAFGRVVAPVPLSAIPKKEFMELSTTGSPDVSPAALTPPPKSGPSKYVILSFLVLQNVAAITLMRHSRSSPGEGRWSAQTGVIMQEILKGLFCVTLLRWRGGLADAFNDVAEVLKMGIPAFLYLVQTNMQYIAAAHLDAPTLAVTSQLKVLTTALFSVMMLGRELSKVQWSALALLSMGVALVSVSQLGSGQQRADNGEGDHFDWTGIVAMVTACVLSGLASVYFEKTLKGSQTSIWVRNLQLSLFSVTIGAVGLLTGSDWDHVIEHGFFGGYTASAWMTISVQAIGGLLVALAVTAADSIVKNFSTSIAIVITALLSAMLFGTAIGPLFVLGVAMVIFAVLFYGGLVTLSMCDNMCGI